MLLLVSLTAKMRGCAYRILYTPAFTSLSSLLHACAFISPRYNARFAPQSNPSVYSRVARVRSVRP